MTIYVDKIARGRDANAGRLIMVTGLQLEHDKLEHDKNRPGHDPTNAIIDRLQTE